MHSGTGEIYRGGAEELASLFASDPAIVPISEEAADRIEEGYKAVDQRNRAQRRRDARGSRKRGSGYTR